MTKSIIAQSRFGLGVSDKFQSKFEHSPKQALLKQLGHKPAIEFSSKLPDTKTLALMWEQRLQMKKAKKKKNSSEAKPTKKQKKMMKGLAPNKVAGLFASENIYKQISSGQDLNWRLFEFFSNHFSVSAQGGMLAYLVGAFEKEAIAPNMLGKFEDLLLAVVRHPGMLIYLNNEKSFGPNSNMAKKRKKFGLNENLAREILELHTLGVNGGYNQTDVTELAKAITGWTVKRPKKGGDFGYRYIHQGHEPGRRRVLGKDYPANRQQGERILKDLANHPSTARFVSTKLVRHFVSDNPDPELVGLLTKVWKTTGGDIKQVMQALIQSDLAWQDEKLKFKTPREYLISTMRLLGHKPVNGKQTVKWLTMLGQPPYSAGAPEGYPDTEADWNAPSAIMARIQWVSMVAKHQRVNLDKTLPMVFGKDKSNDNYLAVVRAESRQQAVSLMLLSPEFMRR